MGQLARWIGWPMRPKKEFDDPTEYQDNLCDIFGCFAYIHKFMPIYILFWETVYIYIFSIYLFFIHCGTTIKLG